MWDILDRIHANGDCDVAEQSIPVVEGVRDILRPIRTVRASRHAADVVHAQYGSLVGALAGHSNARVRLITLRGSDVYWRYGGFRDRFGALARCFLSWWGCVRADGIIVMSHAMRANIVGWPFLKRRNVHNLPDPAGEMFWPNNSRDIARALRTRPHRVLIASVHRHNPVKRLELIEGAVRLCRSVGMDVRLTMLWGKTRVEVRGEVENADTVALCSTHEGWPNIVKEALLLKKPFVATDVSDLARYAGASSRNKIVQPSSVDFAFALVDRVASDILGEVGVDSTLAEFHPDVAAVKHKILYKYYGQMR